MLTWVFSSAQSGKIKASTTVRTAASWGPGPSPRVFASPSRGFLGWRSRLSGFGRPMYAKPEALKAGNVLKIGPSLLILVRVCVQLGIYNPLQAIMTFSLN